MMVVPPHHTHLELDLEDSLASGTFVNVLGHLALP